MATKKRKKRKSGLGSAAAPKKKGGKGLMIFLGLAALGTAGYFGYKHMTKSSSAPGASSMLPGASAAPASRPSTIQDFKNATDSGVFDITERNLINEWPIRNIFRDEPSLGAWTTGWWKLLDDQARPASDWESHVYNYANQAWKNYKKSKNLI